MGLSRSITDKCGMMKENNQNQNMQVRMRKVFNENLYSSNVF